MENLHPHDQSMAIAIEEVRAIERSIDFGFWASIKLSFYARQLARAVVAYGRSRSVHQAQLALSGILKASGRIGALAEHAQQRKRKLHQV
jgi:hypothetical protein